MEFIFKAGSLEKQQADCWIVPIFTTDKHPTLGAAATLVDNLTGQALTQLIQEGDISAQVGDTLMLHQLPNITTKRVLLVGFGEDPTQSDAFIKALKAIAQSLKGLSGKRIVFALEEVTVPDHDAAWKARMLVQQLEAAWYTFDLFKSPRKDDAKKVRPAASHMVLLHNTDADKDAVTLGLSQGQGFSIGIGAARTLGNMPGNVCTPSYLAEQAQELAKTSPKLTTKVLSESQMTKLGMGAFMSVSKGSSESGQLIIMEYKGTNSQNKPYVFLGKGITFDSGGISLKPGAAMDEMKFDMCGAASVMGLMHALVALQLPVHVIGMIAAAENMPAGHASKPGDIVTTLSGKTVEILNTDAEGRLVLCDALTYAERFNPEFVVDIATLTGACIIALGHHTSAVMSNQDALAKALIQAGEKAQDKAWQLPLSPEYQEQLDSKFADMANIGGRPAGSITAGCFLSRFAESFPWAHLDIAGTAWTSGSQKGASGRPVALLLQFVLDKLHATQSSQG